MGGILEPESKVLLAFGDFENEGQSPVARNEFPKWGAKAEAGKESPVQSGLRVMSRGLAGTTRQGGARHVRPGCGATRQARLGETRTGVARHGQSSHEGEREWQDKQKNGMPEQSPRK